MWGWVLRLAAGQASRSVVEAAAGIAGVSEASGSLLATAAMAAASAPAIALLVWAAVSLIGSVERLRRAGGPDSDPHPRRDVRRRGSVTLGALWSLAETRSLAHWNSLNRGCGNPFEKKAYTFTDPELPGCN